MDQNTESGWKPDPPRRRKQNLDEDESSKPLDCLLMEGFVAYYWVDAGSGVMISTSVFQDQASAEESNRRAADYVRQNLVSVLPNPPQITAGEVVAYKAQ